MSTPWPSPSSRSLLGVFDEGAGWAGTGTAGRAQGHHRRGEVRGGGEPGRARAAGASLRGARVGKVVWGDAAQKSTQGCREAACGLGGGGGQGASRGAGTAGRRPSPHLGPPPKPPAQGTQLSSPCSPRGFGSLLLRSQSFAQVPGRPCREPAPAARRAPCVLPVPPGPRVSPGGGGRPCPPPRAAAAPGRAGWGRGPWRGAQDRAIAATCGTARGD